MLSEADYDRLAGQPKPKITRGEYLLQGPSFGGVDLSRDRSPGREVDFGHD